MSNESKQVCAILSPIVAIFGFMIATIILDPAAVILGILGVSSKNGAYRAASISGIVIGSIGTAIGLVMIAML